jgi:prepilin-type N-terminal cleavage/methylation domain-containing protein
MTIATKRPSRSGFTLVELLVVIAIIATLAALTAGAVFRVIASQQLKRTEATIKKVQTGLSLQWQAVVDDVRDELRSKPTDSAKLNAYSNATGLANGDPARFRAIYLKLRLMQEFPTSFAEALVGGKPTYFNALNGVTGPGQPLESAVCLYLAINQGRRGQTFNNEDVGAGSVKTVALAGAKVPLNYYVDAWGQPITFDRWIANDADPIVAELSGPPYASTQLNTWTGMPNADKDDPESALYIAKTGWSQTDMSNVAGIIGHPITQNAPRNRGFIIRSGGPNKNYGDGDDILGFRLMKEGQRGN